jgi:hypothetical protein
LPTFRPAPGPRRPLRPEQQQQQREQEDRNDLTSSDVEQRNHADSACLPVPGGHQALVTSERQAASVVRRVSPQID